jgi:putative addiction module antidote
MKLPPTDPIILTVTAVGNSLGVLLSKEASGRLEVQEGDKLILTKSPDGYRITVYDPEFAEQMTVARKVMKRRRNALRQLAK